MSLFVKGDTKITAYIQKIPIEIFVSSFYALTSENIFVEFTNPNLSLVAGISGYITDFGDGSGWIQSDPADKVYHNYNTNGTYYISYSAVYNLNNQIYTYNVSRPITVSNQWETYDENQVRLPKELILTPPYSQDQIFIQPNEWGVEDIFNTAISRLQNNIEYLKQNTQIISLQAPSLYFGWFGNNSVSLASGIRWFTEFFNSESFTQPELAVNSGVSYFGNVADTVDNGKYLILLDGINLRAFTNEGNSREIPFYNQNDVSYLFFKPISLDIGENSNIVYLVDQPKNKIYKLNLDFDTPAINIQLTIGGFGSQNDHSKFNSPIEIKYENSYVYIVDYNNNCVKQYNIDLNWVYTYNNTVLQEGIVSVAINPINNLVYILTEMYNVYIFVNGSNSIFESFTVKESNDGFTLKKVIFDDNGDFIYISTEQNVYKYAAISTYIGVFQIPKLDTVKFNSIKRGPYKSILISSPNCVIKTQDVLTTYKIGKGLTTNYWSSDQLMVEYNEFSSDFVYNRSLIRLAQNLKTFRNTLNSKFVIASEQNSFGILSYFSWVPIQPSDLPIFDTDVENETLGIGVNEIHTPAVINRELAKIYKSIQDLADFMSIKTLKVSNADCGGELCWSWKATSCYNLKLPLIRVCNVNPISYSELTQDFITNQEIVYSTKNAWTDAVSKCCT